LLKKKKYSKEKKRKENVQKREKAKRLAACLAGQTGTMILETIPQ